MISVDRKHPPQFVLRFFLSCVLMALVEMMLIRWTSSTIFLLYLFTNFILIACFLGIGIGFLLSERAQRFTRYTPFLITMLILLCYYYSYEYQPVLNSVTGNLDYHTRFFKQGVYPVMLTLPIIFFFVTAIMATLASPVANYFQHFSNLHAYRWELFGTLMGMLLFSFLSYLETPPLMWGALIAILFVYLYSAEWIKHSYFLFLGQLVCLFVMLSVFYADSFKQGNYWSPYYKIHLVPFASNQYAVNVNGLTQQVIESLDQRKKIRPFYFKPYEILPHHVLNRVLIIGSGTGGDVAIALAQGAKHVDAVEIDPKIYWLGKSFNPNQPYFDPRVTVYIQDGRSFIQNSRAQYDLIIYALTDALALVPGLSSVRLENYLYTVQGLAAAKARLTDQGAFVIYNYYGYSWAVNRLANTLNLVYDRSPCIVRYTGEDYWATVLMIRKTNTSFACPTIWNSAQAIHDKPITDDKPFLYLHQGSLPILNLLSLVVMSFFVLLTMRVFRFTFGMVRTHLDLFLMGVAFLFLETKSIVTFALLFGPTWQVNTLVFTAVLLSVLLATYVSDYLQSRRGLIIAYSLLMLSLLLAYWVPGDALLQFEFPVRFLFASLLAFSPVLFSNCIFASKLRAANSSSTALGVNLIGAVLGGMGEYVSLYIGYQFFPLIVGGIYLLVAFL